MESWSIEVDKENLKFSSAHFLIFPDGSAERLHGHNYRVYVKVSGELCEHGLVFDFQKVKPVVRSLVGELDERWLIPGEHKELKVVTRDDGIVEVRYRERYYAAPAADILILPINNTSAENLAAWVGRHLRERLESAFPGASIHALEVAVEETPGQRGVYRFEI
ncbi:MAG: 6-carboxytetrahydropterin synthase [Planctomycetes bacterium]|jgi:6-pyruvoyltetrahydropterin/6-carboxytetrahydropterin synthase|nr:6-carboxytetrahydropterin synthase [Planctomycetota bacterium]MBT4029098.1 6-carboxytetrahydropterin synthase [Planctomycetota bacterium]MBT4560476.1 6-carboxytetrahydropterin synthase [Planctomycetota bacterium]MBT5102165.1 6-carboxytetrahydropterin synthase [Planctomycetota bacterium]MBT5119412.1 6-carboxytetrahydropterin synthase [Planctomycetota bacterium]